MTQSNYTTAELLNMPPLELVAWLDESFINPLPIPETIAEFAQFNYLLGELANTYAYLTSLHSMMQIAVRDAKRTSQNKDHINDCIDRRDIVENYMNAVKLQYTAFSRMITVRQQAIAEMQMMGNT